MYNTGGTLKIYLAQGTMSYCCQVSAHHGATLTIRKHPQEVLHPTSQFSHFCPSSGSAHGRPRLCQQAIPQRRQSSTRPAVIQPPVHGDGNA
jgi:hypothetical protein